MLVSRGGLATPICSTSARTTGRVGLAQADDQLLVKFTDRQSVVDHGVDRLAADVGIFEVEYVHAVQLAPDLLRRTNTHAASGLWPKALG